MRQTKGIGESSVAYRISFLCRRLSITPAIFWSFGGTAVSVAAGPLTAIAITQHLNAVSQGYYYTFNSLLALSVFLELGFTVCLVQFISHEYSKLSISIGGELSGDPIALIRLISLARLTVKWFLIAAVLAFFGLGIGGEMFFRSQDGTDTIQWRAAWWLLCLGSSLNLIVIAAQAILDGIDQVAWNMRIRLFQNLVRSIFLIAGLYLGGGLLSPGVAMAAGLVIAFCGLRKWGPLLRQIKNSNAPLEELLNVSWRKELFPMQWRIAISWASGYFIFSAFTPIIFSNCGPVVAGQFGMTWSIIQSLGSVGQIFFMTRAPRFGMLIAKNGRLELRALWKTALAQSLLTVFIGVTCLSVIILFIRRSMPGVAERFLELHLMIPLFLAILLNQFVVGVAVLSRAEKREPFLLVSVLVGIITLLSTFISARNIGMGGVVWGYFFSTSIGFIMAAKILRSTVAFSASSLREENMVHVG